MKWGSRGGGWASDGGLGKRAVILTGSVNKQKGGTAILLKTVRHDSRSRFVGPRHSLTHSLIQSLPLPLPHSFIHSFVQ